MKIHNIPAILVIFVIVLLAGLASSKITPDIVESKWDYLLCLTLCIVWGVAAAIAALVIILNGLRYIASEDLGGKTEVKNRIMHAIIALCVILITMPLVDYLARNTDVEEFECDCLGGIPTRMVVKIEKPGDGWRYDDGKLITFESSVFGGKPPYEYEWTSNYDGYLRSVKSFRKILSVNVHTIRLVVTDARGVSSSDEIQIEVTV